MIISRFRDLTILKQTDESFLAIACDSCGGVGPKEQDIVKTDGETAGYFTAQVVLAELIAAGVRPQVIINALSVEENPTGRKIIAGVLRAAAEAGMDQKAVTGSTEENFPVVQTGIGMTALGTAPRWPLHQSRKGHLLALVGIPCVGDAVLNSGEDKRLSLKTLLRLRFEPPFTNLIEEILPVGSKGALAEAACLAETAKASFVPEHNLPSRATASGGPSTAAVISLSEGHLGEIKEKLPLPFLLLGRLA